MVIALSGTVMRDCETPIRPTAVTLTAPTTATLSSYDERESRTMVPQLLPSPASCRLARLLPTAYLCLGVTRGLSSDDDSEDRMVVLRYPAR